MIRQDHPIRACAAALAMQQAERERDLKQMLSSVVLALKDERWHRELEGSLILPSVSKDITRLDPCVPLSRSR